MCVLRLSISLVSLMLNAESSKCCGPPCVPCCGFHNYLFLKLSNLQGLTISLHHGGKFVEDDNGKLSYEEGAIQVLYGCDEDLLSYFSFKNAASELGYTEALHKMYWYDPSLPFADGLKALECDKDVLDMVAVANLNKLKISIYFEHKVLEPDVVEIPPLLMDQPSQGYEETVPESQEDGEENEKDCEETPTPQAQPDCEENPEVQTQGQCEEMSVPEPHGDGEEMDVDSDGRDEIPKKRRVFKRPKNDKVYEDVSSDDSATEGTYEVHSDDDLWRSEELQTPDEDQTESEEDAEKEVFPQFNSQAKFGHVDLELGMEFNSLDDFKQAVRDYNINLGREIKWLKNDKIRARARCKGENCSWEIYCAKNNVNHCFQIKTFRDEHSCGRTFKNKQASQNWVAGKLVSKMRKKGGMKHREAFDYVRQKYGVHVNHKMIYRSMLKAKEVVQGNEKEQYGKLWDYCATLKRVSPTSTIKMDTIPQPEGPPMFHRLYICLAGCRDGFREGCRPFIGLDGCFLKGYYEGQLLCAVGQDSNNHIWPIAWAVVDVENTANWTWFLELLEYDIGDHRQKRWCFISDAQKVKWGLLIV